MSRAAAKGGRKPLPPGSEFNWQKVPGELPETAPTPLFPAYEVPQVEKLQGREKKEVERYRTLREHFHNGPYYAVVNAASTSAKQGTKERAQFDPFHGMQSYSSRYQKRKRTIPKIAGREYIVNFFPRELWRIVRPNYKPDQSHTGFAMASVSKMRAQFEDDEEDEEDNVEEGPSKQQKGDNDDVDEQDDKSVDDEEDKENEEEDDELRDDDFSEDDDDMGGDYNAEQYFDAGDDEGDGDGFGDGGGGGGGGDDDFY
ncbi:DNA-directed RNA polymerase III, subunit Rpc31 [Talaromyces proteolyticus]|uniref:DNA-directed RNA polymerase III subunit n=1 Tax=Talaromyces proteolyticus TaxID=1131652 RepID=A0AAD4KXT6_9EURO|nr:DNA-directed RNA polymerase III, subunit Rpc31 [Talaromyces proteolyticus]KAH8702489.1 DNA-directed RNA polymerase III, subunit Rpc31 [Talaromyces proteolyticus]